jgi:hypothetical protein
MSFPLHLRKIDWLFSTSAFEEIMIWVIFQPPSSLFQVLCGICLAFQIHYTIRFVYLSRFHQLVLALFMSLVGDQVLFFFPLADHSEPPFLTNLHSYAHFTLIEWGTCVLTLLSLSLLRETVTHFITGKCALLFLCFRALWLSRMFHHFPAHFVELDDRIALIISLLASHWSDFIDFIARKVTAKRAALRLGRGTAHLLLATVCYMMSRHSRISDIIGFCPFDYSCTLLFIIQIVSTLTSFFLHLCPNRTPSPIWK